MFTRMLAAAAVLISGLSPALSAPIPKTELSRYINSIRSAEANFTQVNYDGSMSSGILKIERPYRMRWEYQNENMLVLASGGQVAIFDGRGAPQQYPMSRTPLSLILAPSVDFNKSGMVFSHQEHNGQTVVHARDPGAPERGHIQLNFTANPTRLVSWIVIDEMGDKTHMFLENFRPGVAFLPSTFSIPNEMDRRQ